MVPSAQVLICQHGLWAERQRREQLPRFRCCLLCVMAACHRKLCWSAALLSRRLPCPSLMESKATVTTVRVLLRVCIPCSVRDQHAGLSVFARFCVLNMVSGVVSFSVFRCESLSLARSCNRVESLQHLNFLGFQKCVMIKIGNEVYCCK